MKKQTFLFASGILFTMFSCGTATDTTQENEPNVDEVEVENIDTPEELETEEIESEAPANSVSLGNDALRLREEIYTYVMEKYLDPQEGASHKLDYLFDEDKKLFTFTFTTMKPVDSEEKDATEDVFICSGNWVRADEEEGVGILVLEMELSWTNEVFLEEYGEFKKYTERDENTKELSVNYNVPAERNFFGSPLYLKAVSEKLAEDDLEDMSKEEMSYLRNEIFARRGHMFKTDKMKTYFGAKKWYKAYNADAAQVLSEIEKANADFIKSVEDKK